MTYSPSVYYTSQLSAAKQTRKDHSERLLSRHDIVLLDIVTTYNGPITHKKIYLILGSFLDKSRVRDRLGKLVDSGYLTSFKKGQIVYYSATQKAHHFMLLFNYHLERIAKQQVRRLKSGKF